MTASRKLSEPDDSPAGEESLALGGLEGLLGFHLRLAHTAIYRDFAATLAELGLTQKQSATLWLVAANPGVSQVEIAATLGMDRATMMAIVDRLDARNLLRRERSRVDRRRQELYLSEEGKKVYARSRELVAEHEARFTSRFKPKVLAQLIEALKIIEGSGGQIG